VSFVSVAQQFTSSTPMGRLTLNILLSFAHNAERAIMQSQGAEVGLWPAFW
jgi:DNA invertase Pin-like site-specific DNA recombinase